MLKLFNGILKTSKKFKNIPKISKTFRENFQKHFRKNEKQISKCQKNSESFKNRFGKFQKRLKSFKNYKNLSDDFKKKFEKHKKSGKV